MVTADVLHRKWSLPSSQLVYGAGFIRSVAEYQEPLAEADVFSLLLSAVSAWKQTSSGWQVLFTTVHRPTPNIANHAFCHLKNTIFFFNSIQLAKLYDAYFCRFFVIVKAHYSKRGIFKVYKAFLSRICHAVVFTQFGYADSKSAPCQAVFLVFPL